MSTFDPNDERITAYILGDDSLSAVDRNEVATLLSTNPEAQLFAEELRMAASMAGSELAMETIPAMAPTAVIENAVRKELARPSKSKGWMLFAQWTVAASLVVGATVYFMPQVQQAREGGVVLLSAKAPAAKMPAPAPNPEQGNTAGSVGGYGSVYGAAKWKEVDEKAPAPSSGGRGTAGSGETFEYRAKWAKDLYEKEKSAVPIPDEPPIKYVEPRAWEELSARRLKYRATDGEPQKDSGGKASGGAVADDRMVASSKMGGDRGRGAEREDLPLPDGLMEDPKFVAKVDARNKIIERKSGGPAETPPRRQDLGFAEAQKPDGKPSAEGLGEVAKLHDEVALGRKPADAPTSAPADVSRVKARQAAPDRYALDDEMMPMKKELKDLDAAAAPKPAAPGLPALNPAPKPGQTVALAVKPAQVSDYAVIDPLGTVADGSKASDKRYGEAETKLKLDGAQPAHKEAEDRKFTAGNTGGYGSVFGKAAWKAWDEGRGEGFNRESYPVLKENDFIQAKGDNALSTFSIDVDSASYALVRKFITQNTPPPPGAVRLEEMVNYFRYNYETPKGETPFAANLEIAECPWNPEHRLARIALKGKEIDVSKRPPSNLVFLVDVSGSMDEPNKLPLVKESLKLLVDQLGENDHVGMVVYAAGTGVVLDSTNGNKKSEINYAIDNLRASGSTNGAGGIQLAYETAVKGFIKGGTNRVILCTDGDFNVGVTSDDELVKLITEKAKSGVFLSTLAVGEGNLQDKKMMELSNKGNGNYGYLDSIREARKLLVEQMTGTLLTIAKDVKIQVEFNPAKVGAYRLIGYEKRMLKNEDFKDDKKDAGEIGAGHTVTALYEIVPAGKTSPAVEVGPLAFQKPAEAAKLDPELAKATCLIKLRYKQPDGDKSTEVSFPGKDEGKKYTQASEDFRWAATVASFAMILRDSPYKGNATPGSVLELAQAAKGYDPGGYRAEFIKLVEIVKENTKK